MKTYWVIEQVIHGVTLRVSNIFGYSSDLYPSMLGAVNYARQYANARKRLGMNCEGIVVKQVELYK